jgi:uncharacterized protein (UPF0276 family)
MPKLLALLRAESEAVSVLEIEPQMLWKLSRAGSRDSYQVNQELLEELAGLPQKKLLHSVGLPVGSSRPIDPAQIPLLRSATQSLQAPWVSEHLSFNAFDDGGSWTSAGFLLPPCQIPETVARAADKLRTLARALDIPVAFETGVNYLRRQAGEMSDGEFFRSVAEAADCGILVDLHNLWANERNGRGRVGATLSQLPLDRVWEIHLAGGMELDGCWLDAHSGAIPEPVLDLAAEWIPKMPNLGALIFEILDDHVPSIGPGGVLEQLRKMHSLWALHGSEHELTVRAPSGSGARSGRAPGEDPVRSWERALGSLVIGREGGGELANRLRADPGLEVLRKLVDESRAGLISQGLRYTMSLLLGTLEPSDVHELLSEFMRLRPPEIFASAEAHAFASFLEGKSLSIPYLNDVLAFEHALIRAVLFQESSTVLFEHEPTALFESLDAGRVPRDATREPTALVVRPE